MNNHVFVKYSSGQIENSFIEIIQIIQNTVSILKESSGQDFRINFEKGRERMSN